MTIESINQLGLPPNTFIPNSYEKCYFEQWLGRKLTDEEFEEICDAIVDDLADDVSDLVMRHVKAARIE